MFNDRDLQRAAMDGLDLETGVCEVEIHIHIEP